MSPAMALPQDDGELVEAFNVAIGDRRTQAACAVTKAPGFNIIGYKLDNSCIDFGGGRGCAQIVIKPEAGISRCEFTFMSNGTCEFEQAIGTEFKKVEAVPDFEKIVEYDEDVNVFGYSCFDA